jgi:hypothetical protein
VFNENTLCSTKTSCVQRKHAVFSEEAHRFWNLGDAAAPRLLMFHAQHARLTPLGDIDAAAPRLVAG